MHKLVRITTVPVSLEKLLEGQLTFMKKHFDIIAISSDKDRLHKFGKNNDVKTYHLEMTRTISPLKDIKALASLFKYLRKEKPTIVHTHTPKAGIIGMLAAKLAGVPIRLHTVAGMPLMEKDGIKRKVLNRVEKLTYSLATKVYPNSKGLKDIILNEKFAFPSKLKVLGNGSSNGIDTKYFDPDLFSVELKRKLRGEMNIPLKNVVFIFVGRLVSEKGIQELVNAFINVYKDRAEISLLLVGNYEEDLDPLSKDTLDNINNHPGIISVGYQQDVRPYFAISDLLTFPSYREGFPNVVMQAGAMGLPSIVTNINGCNEIIKENLNGVIISPKDEKELRQAMIRFLNNPELMKNMAANARSEICSKFERKVFWDLVLWEYWDLQKQL